MRRGWIAAIISLWMALGGVNIAAARDILQGDSCRVGADETIAGNLFVVCRTLDIDGTVEGDVIGATTTARINGRVGGSLYLAAVQLDIDGVVGGDVHFGGGVVRIHEGAQFESPQADLLTVSLSANIERGVSISGSASGVGYQLILNGDVGREIRYWGSALTIGGEVGGAVDGSVGGSETGGVGELRSILNLLSVDVTLFNPGLYVTPDARINGQLTYASTTQATIEGTLGTPVLYIDTTPPLLSPDEGLPFSEAIGRYLVQLARDVITLFVLGALALILAPRVVRAPMTHLRYRPLRCLAVGLLGFILSFPVLLVAILISLILALIFALLRLNDLALLSGGIFNAVNLGAASIFYFVAIVVSRIVVALAIGGALLRLTTGEIPGQRGTLIGLALGTIGLSILGALPFVGWLFNALAAFLGLGAILTRVSMRVEPLPPRPVSAVAFAPPLDDEPPRIAPPPVEDDPPQPPGGDNLPDGFRWWD